MTNSKNYAVDGHRITVKWHRINPNSSAAMAQYKLFTFRDGKEISSEFGVGMDDVSRVCRMYARREEQWAGR